MIKDPIPEVPIGQFLWLFPNRLFLVRRSQPTGQVFHMHGQFCLYFFAQSGRLDFQLFLKRTLVDNSGLPTLREFEVSNFRLGGDLEIFWSVSCHRLHWSERQKKLFLSLQAPENCSNNLPKLFWTQNRPDSGFLIFMKIKIMRNSRISDISLRNFSKDFCY